MLFCPLPIFPRRSSDSPSRTFSVNGAERMGLRAARKLRRKRWWAACAHYLPPTFHPIYPNLAPLPLPDSTLSETLTQTGGPEVKPKQALFQGPPTKDTARGRPPPVTRATEQRPHSLLADCWSETLNTHDSWWMVKSLNTIMQVNK